jgi:hypothetical protein
MVSELGLGLAGPKDLGRYMGVDNICLFCFSLRALKSNVDGMAAKADMFGPGATCGSVRDNERRVAKV